MTGAIPPNYSGFRKPSPQNGGTDLDIYIGGSQVVDGTSAGLTMAAGKTFTAPNVRLSGSGFFGLGAAESATVASGVLTVTRPYVDVLPESSTSDTVDSIVYTGASDGDFLLLVSKATNTITVDDANISLGAATRAIAPGGSLLLFYNGTQWVEHSFLTASDNS